MGWNPATGELWTVVNERDEIGSDLVPDYMTSVRAAASTAGPYSYYGQHVDDRIQPQRPDLVAKAIVPDYALGPHTASLGLAFYEAAVPAHLRRRRVRRPARLLEPPAAERLPVSSCPSRTAGLGPRRKC
jgi:glucose/arabinose dehydrogenase